LFLLYVNKFLKIFWAQQNLGGELPTNAPLWLRVCGQKRYNRFIRIRIRQTPSQNLRQFKQTCNSPYRGFFWTAPFRRRLECPATRPSKRCQVTRGGRSRVGVEVQRASVFDNGLAGKLKEEAAKSKCKRSISVKLIKNQFGDITHRHQSQ